jgi:hypothetical protein
MIFRSSFRRLVYSLPTHWQLQIKEFMLVLRRQYDWAVPIKHLRQREQSYLEDTALKNRQFPDRKRVFICSLQKYPPWLETEFVLATALRLRGQDVQSMLCDGVLPICELNLGLQERPSCEACTAWLSRYEDAFGFGLARLSDFLSKNDRERAEELVNQTPMGDLNSLVVDGVRVGRLARSELQRYYRGYVFDPLGQALGAYRQWLVAGILLTWLFERTFDRYRPDILVASSGKTLLAACAIEVAQQRDIHVVTWDTSALYRDGLMFRHDVPADDVNLDDVWDEVSKQELSDIQLNELNEFIGRWSRSENTPFSYNPSPLENEQIIRQNLGLRSQSAIVVAYTNTSWDMAVVDRDIGFESMYDWVFSLVQYAISHPEIELIVRAHPAEKKTPHNLQTTTPVVPEIKKRFRSLPGNVKFIEGDNPISSYTLANMAQVVTLYASMLGLELAMRGIRPWIAGDVNYRAKGFTLDLTSKEHMVGLLDKNTFKNRLTEDEVRLAQKFAYLWFFRHIFLNPFVQSFDYRFNLESFQALAQGGNPVMDDLCDALLTTKPFVDIGHVNQSR